MKQWCTPLSLWLTTLTEIGFTFCAIAYYRTFSFGFTLVFESEALFPEEEGFRVEANSPNL